MRRIVRPFVKEFKSRSAKAASSRIVPLDEAAAEQKPAFLDLAAFAPRVVERETPHDDGYEAAMKAADLVFGKKAEAIKAEAVSAQPASTGRVLPSLIEPIAPPPEPEAPVRRGPGRPRGVKKAVEPKIVDAESDAPIRAARRPKAPKAAPAPRPAPEPIAIVARQPPAPAPIAVARVESETTSRRTRRAIQLRWVLGTELRAGEKWKRRLPEAAR